MDYEKNREFIKDYVSSVIEDLGPMFEPLICGDDYQYNYNVEEVKELFFDHISKTEFNRFCEIYNKFNDIIYMDVFEIIHNYVGIFKGFYEYDVYIENYEFLYDRNKLN